MAFVLADASADRLQGFPKGTGGFPLSFTGINLDAACCDKRQRGVVVHLGASVRAHLRVQIGDLYQPAWSSTSGDDDFHPFRSALQRPDHIFGFEEAKIQDWIQFIENHHGVQSARNGAFGDVPTPLSFLSVEAFDLVHTEIVSPAGSHLIDQVGEALLQSFDRGVFVVSPTWTF